MSEAEEHNNYQEICRICLKSENLKALRDKHENVNIIEMLQTCLVIQIDENDGLSQKICSTCIIELAQAYKFAKKFQTTFTEENNPSPVTLIQSIDADTNAEEFVLPDEFILIDKNIIKKIKNHNGKMETPSPSDELKEAKLKIINAAKATMTIVDESTSTNILNNKLNKTDDEKSGKINILSIKTYNTNINELRENNTKNITNLQLDSLIETKSPNISEVKQKERKSKWNTRNKIQNTHKNKKLKKKIKQKDPLYSSEKYHEQFEKFLTIATKPENNSEEIKECSVEEPKNKRTRQQQQTNNINKKTTHIKNKIVTGYMRRFGNKKECPLCKKCFKYLEPHLRCHRNQDLATLKEELNEKNEKGKTLFDCEFCDRKFYRKNLLLNHMKTHKDRIYNCSMCEKSFREMLSLQRHLNMHTKSNLYECNICNKAAYNIKSNLYRHQRVCILKNKNNKKG